MSDSDEFDEHPVYRESVRIAYVTADGRFYVEGVDNSTVPSRNSFRLAARGKYVYNVTAMATGKWFGGLALVREDMELMSTISACQAEGLPIAVRPSEEVEKIEKESRKMYKLLNCLEDRSGRLWFGYTIGRWLRDTRPTFREVTAIVMNEYSPPGYARVPDVMEYTKRDLKDLAKLKCV